MKLQKKLELNFKNNDLYILENLGGNFLINKNNTGTIILNSELKLVESFNFRESLYMYYVYTNPYNKDFIIYDPDKSKIIYTDYSNKKIIKLSFKDLDIVFYNIYIWLNNKIIFYASDKFYELDLHAQHIEESSYEKIRSHYTDFFNFVQLLQIYENKYQINSFQKSFIYENEKDNIIGFYDLLQNTKIRTRKPDLNYHDIIYKNGFFCFVSERKLIISKKQDSLEILPEDSLYVFLRARWLEENNKLFLIVFTSNNSNSRINKIIKYELI